MITEFKYGDLISTIINFAIIAFLVFLASKQLSKYGFVEDKTKPAEEKSSKEKVIPIALLGENLWLC